MTVLEASNKLYNWFAQHDCFSITSGKTDSKENHFREMIVLSDDPEHDKAAVIAALDEYEKANFVKRVDTEGAKHWVLKRPFDTYEQNVTIDPDLAGAIAELVNAFSEASKNKTDFCTAANITTHDLRSLVLICSHLLKK